MTSALDRLGARHKKALAEIEAIRPGLQEAMREERTAGMSQDELAKRSGYSIQQVRNITAGIKPARPA